MSEEKSEVDYKEKIRHEWRGRGRWRISYGGEVVLETDEEGKILGDKS